MLIITLNLQGLEVKSHLQFRINLNKKELLLYGNPKKCR